jgi:predicted secreted hydrolase
MKRLARSLMCMLLWFAPVGFADEPHFPPVTPGATLAFPRDHGAHPQFRTEWWYATGHLTTESGRALGFQVTFFRSRTGIGEDSPSKLAPSQIIFAHAAIADASHGKLRHDERIARAGSHVYARTEALDILLDRWSMKLKENVIATRVQAKDFTLDLDLAIAKPPVLQGDNGYSRKGPLPQQASYYVSMVQLQVSGNVSVAGKSERVKGIAWFDHEWSSEYLAADAAGWDWLGANFDDGGALMAFRMRAKNGTVLWASATRVHADGKIDKLALDQVSFVPLRTWRSPRTGATWPVEMQLTVGAETLMLRPWMDDQELDSARSTGITYWEGAVDVMRSQQRVGRGYLELTGYVKPIRF